MKGIEDEANMVEVGLRTEPVSPTPRPARGQRTEPVSPSPLDPRTLGVKLDWTDDL